MGDAHDIDLETFPEDWDRALAVVAHPDDMEYGAASAVARWTAQGKDVRYLLLTKGEAGISSMPPEEVGPARVAEQIAGCAAVGVTDVEFLDHPDGLIEANLTLRRDLAAAIRRNTPDVVLSINFREGWGAPSWNHADHRATGVALLDAVRDAANPWLFRDLGLEAWGGVRLVAFGGSPVATHAVDVTDTIEAGIESLRCHELYLANLDGDMADPGDFLRAGAEEAGPLIGVELATTFEILRP
jgi:LmbE family N-acetylglucosaminyl deacetylase